MKGEKFVIEGQNIYMPLSIHVVDAARLDEDDETTDEKIVSSIDKYISCSVSNENAHPKLSSLIKRDPNTQNVI